MAENVRPTSGGAPSGDATAGKPYYEKTRQQLKMLLDRRKALEMRLANTEDDIYEQETAYLESTIGGNIITGFDSYTKGVSNAAAQRRKMGLNETNRVFSRSSISYNANSDAMTPASAPGSAAASHAPTPVSTSFANKDAGDQATPTSATTSKGAGPKKSKKAGAAGNDDSDAEVREPKKVRTNFGAGRK